MPRRPLGAGRPHRAPFLVPLLVVAFAADAASTQDRPGRGRRNAPIQALKAGTVHPVSGPAIENGVVLFRGSRIVAVGPAAEVEIPDGTTVLDYPDGHVYPGLVDALSRAFAGSAAEEGGLDAGAAFGEGLDRFDLESQSLVKKGITTAYISNRAGTTWRGQGALVRPQAEGFRAFPEHDTAGVHMRLTTGPGASHPLQRSAQLEGFGGEFAQLEAYEKGFETHAKKAEEYAKKFEEFLEWHRKRAPKEGEEGKADGEKKAAPPPATEGGPPSGERRGGRRGPPRPGGGTPPAGGEPKPAEQGGRSEKPAEAAKPQEAGKPDRKKPEEKAPERPKFPAEPKRDPTKDALIAVRDGELALFVEVHRPEEVRRALEIAREHQLRRVVLEHATGAASVVGAIADAGIPVVVESALPPATARIAPAGATYVDEREAWTSVASRLAGRGVPVAIGSGSVRRARHLPALVAEAIGAGMPADTALRAVTLTPAEILGVADRVGSLEPRKLADLIVTSAPLESSDARVLRVISAGTTVHEDRR